MAQTIADSILKIIKKDDVKAFNALMEQTQCGACRLGRFPVLSLLYLYKSRRILSVYEQSFLKITNFEELREPMEISKKFSSKAGKCLRLYFNEVVTPLEMLMILDNTKRLKRVFPQIKPSSAVKGRLKSIYYIRYSLGVRFVGDDIIIEKRPLSYSEKKRIATICICLALAVVIAIGAPITTVALIPKPIEGEATKLSHIKFNSTKEYVLKKDIVVPKNYTVDKVNCKIIGEGHKLIFREGATLGELNGSISDLTIESVGNAIFTSVSENATIENVTVNVNSAVSKSEASAFVALTNYGTINGVTVNVKGKINAVSTSTAATEELAFGGIVLENTNKYDATTQEIYSGVIKNCIVNYSQFELVGEASANALFGGVAGINNGYLQNCTVTGEITSDTFDIAGVCAVNNGLLSGNINEANLTQTSADTGWNPIVAGIVLNNYYAVEKCQNKGNLLSVSDCGEFETQEGYESTVSACGIAYLNRSVSRLSYIINSVNLGSIESKSKYRNSYASGVCISSNGAIENCKNSGSVTVASDNGCDAYAGGITSLAYGYILKSENYGAITATGNGKAYVGGVSALSRSQFLYCYSSGDITVTAKNIYAGGIFGVSEVIANPSSYICGGTAEYCISGGKIKVTSIGDKPAYVGGIAGYINESVNDDRTYLGGSIISSYFIGEYLSDTSYFGNIVGVIGANIYQNNLFIFNNIEYQNLENNYYVDNSLKAIGATVTEDESFATVEDKGAMSTTIEDILNSQTYQSILNELGK